MNDLSPLIDYLKIWRRNDEAQKNERYTEGKILDENYYLDTPGLHYVLKEDLEDVQKFTPLSSILLESPENMLYISEEASGELNYYIRKTGIDSEGNSVLKYKNIDQGDWHIMDESDFFAIELDSHYSFYYYDRDNNRVLLFSLDTVFVFPDWFIYNPNDTPEIASGEYEFNYKDHEGYTNDIADSFFRSLMDGPLGTTIANSKRKVEVYKSPKIGKVNLYPGISLSSRKFILTYNYIVNDSSFNPEANLPFRFQSEDTFAIKLEFSYLGACLEFLNQIIFYDSADTNFLKGSGSRQLFYDSYSRVVNNAIQWGLGESVERALEILYYVPRSFLIDINLDLLWEILEKTLQSTTVTNWGLNKEDIVLELLKTLGTAEKTKNIFLLKLLHQNKKKENLFSLLYRKMNGANFVKYVKFIHQIWKESRFRIPDIETNPEYDTTDGKLFLPYRSEKWLGIYSSNTDVSFEGSLIKVELETGNYKTVEVPSDTMGSSPKTIDVEIIDRFKYHPFYPVYIENVEKQETEIKFETIIPAFMLKANEDKEFWHNAIKTGEYTLDVVTTLSGIGNLAKFRHLTKLAEIAAVASDVSNANKIIKTANVLRYVKGAAGVVEITSGSVNAMLKLTGLDETESGRSLSKVLFFLELITLTGELTVSLNGGLKKAAKEAIDNSDGALRAKHPELFADLYKIAGLKKIYHHIDDFMQLRPKYHDLALVNKLWKERIINKMLFTTNLRKLYAKYLKEFPSLQKGFNQAEFKTTIFNQGKKVDEVVEFSLSGKKEKLLSSFGNPPDLPKNTIDILNDYDNFEAFVKGAKDFADKPRNYDSEIKYIFNFLKNHINKGDEFIIETKNIFKTCGSCRREFVMLEDYLKLQRKKVKFVVFSDETIEGTAHLKKKLKIK